ncbi:hypothetical protein [Urbifossiella limnaea]|uniref:Uncharacterized protein n=1 Tax=Urbifossiella limnaea TaxID=2528023 RepID=A0A517XST9_9BACT|nr:hypothetical protein [Urbifossiella limnaea]QDU20590.1 hypothetical protein ETAA1_25450 [Urbifossiella limnaea]
MGTRAMILVLGQTDDHQTLGRDKDAVKAIRLHNHGDGGPTNILDDLVEATRYCEGFLLKRMAYLSHRLGRDATAFDLPACVWAESVKFAGLGVFGPTTIHDAVNVEDRHDPGAPRAVFMGDAALDDNLRWGNQGDLEWLYLIDVKASTITVYGGDYGDPEEHLGVGPVDPRLETLSFEDSYQPTRLIQITRAMKSLRDAGWSITPGKRKRGLTTTWLNKLLYRAVCKLTVDIPDDWRTEAVFGLTSGILNDRVWGRCGVLADALDDAGCNDGELLAGLRALAA